MPKDLLAQRLDYPSFFLFSYDPIPSGGSAVLLFGILKVYLKLIMLEIKYRLLR